MHIRIPARPRLRQPPSRSSQATTLGFHVPLISSELSIQLCGVRQYRSNGIQESRGWCSIDSSVVKREAKHHVIAPRPGHGQTAQVRSTIRPIPSMPICGGFTIGVKVSTEYIPRLVILNVPPSVSSNDKRPSLARATKWLLSAAIAPLLYRQHL